jgi:hypothetical protein
MLIGLILTISLTTTRSTSSSQISLLFPWPSPNHLAPRLDFEVKDSSHQVNESNAFLLVFVNADLRSSIRFYLSIPATTPLHGTVFGLIDQQF